MGITTLQFEQIVKHGYVGMDRKGRPTSEKRRIWPGEHGLTAWEQNGCNTAVAAGPVNRFEARVSATDDGNFLLLIYRWTYAGVCAPADEIPNIPTWGNVENVLVATGWEPLRGEEFAWAAGYGWYSAQIIRGG